MNHGWCKCQGLRIPRVQQKSKKSHKVENPHLLLHFGSQRSQNGLTFRTQRHLDGSVQRNLSLVLLVLGAPLGWFDRRDDWPTVMNETWRWCDAPQQQIFGESDDGRPCDGDCDDCSDGHQVPAAAAAALGWCKKWKRCRSVRKQSAEFFLFSRNLIELFQELKSQKMSATK